MVGMFLLVSDSISDSDLNKFRQWAARLYELSQDERFSSPERGWKVEFGMQTDGLSTLQDFNKAGTILEGGGYQYQVIEFL